MQSEYSGSRIVSLMYTKVILGDMRDASLMNEKFDLVTGTPPYFKVEFNASGAARASTLQSRHTRVFHTFFKKKLVACPVANSRLLQDTRFVSCHNVD